MNRSIPNAKRGLALLLSLVLLLSALSLGGVAAKAESCDCKEIPRIFIDGIGGSLYRNAGTPEEEAVSVADTSHMQDALLPIAKNILKAVALQSWDAGADALSALALNLFGQLQCDETGKSLQPISNPYVAPDQDHKTNNHYSFRYDWRMDPMECARELDAYIKLVQASSGHQKVDLIYFSEGGLIATAYLAQFGSGALDQLIPVMAAHNGLSLVGELFNKNIHLNAKAAANLIRTFVGSEGEMGLVDSLVTILEQAGLLDALVNALQILIENVGDRLFAETLTPLFAQWPALWGFVPDSYYEADKAAILDPVKHATLIKTIDDYHYKAGVKTNELLAAAIQNGVKVSLIASYGFPTMPFFTDANLCADGLIDTARESCGATCAPYGSTLGADYKQAIADGHNHLSPNGQIDASTCAFPEQTWFLQNQIHFTFDFNALLDFLVYSDTQPTVQQSAAFPQFMTRLPDGSFVPTVQAPAQPYQPTTLLGALTQFATRALALLF